MTQNKIEASSQQVLEAYCDLMLEVKIRMDAVGKIVSRPSVDPIPVQLLYELCYLQLRMISELIAFACLVAHGDIPATKTGRLQQAYKADFIMNALEKLHPDFYPKATRQVLNAEGVVIAVELVPFGYLTKDEFLRLYNVECGNVLHRGNVMTAKGKINPSAISYEKIQEWLRKLTTLLTHHDIAISTHPEYTIRFLMHASHDGMPHAALFKTVKWAAK
jgi:hypothetical protein